MPRLLGCCFSILFILYIWCLYVLNVISLTFGTLPRRWGQSYFCLLVVDSKLMWSLLNMLMVFECVSFFKCHAHYEEETCLLLNWGFWVLMSCSTCKNITRLWYLHMLWCPHLFACFKFMISLSLLINLIDVVLFSIFQK